MTRVPFFIGIAVIIAALVTGIAVQASFDAEHQSAPPHVVRHAAVFTGMPADVSGQIDAATLLAFFDAKAAEQREQERLEAEEQQRQEAAAAEAARVAAAQQAPRPAPAPSGTSTPTGNHGPHSDAWWWGVAVCEQGGRNDPYFGYFSWMDGSAAGMTWDQQVAKSNALLATVSSESPAWAASCVAAGYRASPGG